MYIENGKISSRQTFRLYVFDFMGIATLLLPPYLAQLCGIDGMWAIGIGSLLGFVYLFYLNYIMKKMDSDILSFLKQERGVVVRGLTVLLVGVHCVVTAGFLGYIFAKLILHSLVQEASYELILLVLLLTAIYAVSGGIQCRARVYEVLFWLVLIPYVAMVLASVQDFEVAYVQGLFSTEVGNLWRGIYLVFLLETPLFFSLFLVREKGKGYSSIIKSAGAALGITTVILLGSYVLLVGNFGAKSLGKMEFPIVTLMSTIQFEGNFLKRMDALMVAVWFFTLFALLNLHLHYGVTMCKEVKGLGNGKYLPRILPGLLAYGVACGLEHMDGAIEGFLSYYSFLAVPLMVVGPALLLIGKKAARTGVVVGMILPLILAGCAKTELEERCFPLLAVVSYEDGQVTFCAGFPRADNTGGSTGQTTELMVTTVEGQNFAQSKDGYEAQLNKMADYNHLKVLVLGEGLLKSEEAYYEMLDVLAKTEEFPRNTYICVVRDTQALLAMDEKLPQDLGTYLEEYLKSHQRSDRGLLTLGDLLDEKENQLLELYAPYLIPEETHARWHGYCSIGTKEIFFCNENE